MMKIQKFSLLAFLTIMILLVGCLSYKMQENKLLSSDQTSISICPKTVGWKGIVPGKTKRLDLELILGQPSFEGHKRINQQDMQYLEYEVTTGSVAKSTRDRFYLSDQGIVLWIIVIEADRSQKIETAENWLRSVGNEVDALYWSGVFAQGVINPVSDIRGPDAVYVSARCGESLIVLGNCFTDGQTLKCDPNFPASSSIVLLRSNSGNKFLRPNVKNPALATFYFPPTTYGNFTRDYRDKIPYDLFINELKGLAKYVK